MMRTRLSMLLVLLVAVAGCRDRASAPDGDTQSPAQRELTALFEQEWQWRLRENPQFASIVGDHRYDDQLSRESIADEQRRSTETQGFLDAIRRISQALAARVLAQLDQKLEDQVTHRLCPS